MIFKYITPIDKTNKPFEQDSQKFSPFANPLSFSHLPHHTQCCFHEPSQNLGLCRTGGVGRLS